MSEELQVQEEERKPIALKHPLDDSHFFIEYGHKRIACNQNLIIVIVGGTGSGKSYTALSLAQAFDKTFNKDRITFKPKEFMKAINSGIKPGGVIMWEEAGVSFSSRKWQSQTNMVLGYVFQTFRALNYITIITVPDLSFIDKQLRKLVHVVLETKKIRQVSKQCVVKITRVKNFPMGDKTYYMYPRIYNENGVGKIKRMSIPIPSEELAKEYELKKDEYLKNLNQEIMQIIEDEETISKIGYREFMRLKKDKTDQENGNSNAEISGKDKKYQEVEYKLYRTLLHLRNLGAEYEEIEVTTGISRQALVTIMNRYNQNKF